MSRSSLRKPHTRSQWHSGGFGKPRILREALEHEALIKAVKYAWWAPFLHHSPNEELDKQARQYAAAKGTRKGFPDLVLPVRTDAYNGLVIELKAPKPFGNSVTPHQDWWLRAFRAAGWRAVVCYGMDEALAELESYTAGVPKIALE